MYGSQYSNKQLLEMMDAKVYGHDRAKKVLINAINRSKIRWHQEFSLGMTKFDLLDTKNTLLIGQSGNGKTYLVETICELCDVPFLRFDATQLKPAGSGEGLTIKQMIKDIQQHCAWLEKLSEGEYTANEIMKMTVVFIDEIDKLALSYESSGNWNKMVQSNLLQLIDGKTQIEGVTFVFAGAFADVLDNDRKITTKSLGFNPQAPEPEEEKNWDEAIVKAGIIPELSGRINSVVKIDNLSKLDYNNILDNHVIPKIYAQLQYYECDDFSLGTEERARIIDKAHGSNQGVRMLYKEVQALVEEYEFNFEERRAVKLLEYINDIQGE